jgi:hypothetical protein
MLTFLVCFLCLAVVCSAAPPQFEAHTIATDLKGGYQVVAVDLNRDGKPDLIALASGMKELVWYENPGWQRHVIAGDLANMINLAAWDWDGDGVPEIVLAHGFSMDPKKSAGIVSVLKHKDDPREAWSIREIDRLTTSHRLRVADIDGSGKKVVVNAPLAGAAAEAPDYRDKVPLVYYRPGEWKREIIGENEGVQHGLYPVDWDGKGRDAILTASFLGIHLFRFGKDGRWSRTELTKGDPAAWPKCGSSDVAVGRLGKLRYLAAIEPWHGNEVVVYREQKGAWQRQVIDDSLVDGHTIAAADLDHDGRDEIIAGYRGKGTSVYIYSADDARGEHWSRQTLDTGIAAAACAVTDLNGDGKPDIACIGATNLKWYESR